MEHNLKAFLGHVSPKPTRELAEAHVKRVNLFKETEEVVLFVDKKYAFNELTSHEHIDQVKRAVQKAFGEHYRSTIQLEAQNHQSEREKTVPHEIHYA